jgi:hypothetical protein
MVQGGKVWIGLDKPEFIMIVTGLQINQGLTSELHKLMHWPEPAWQ